MSPTLLYRIAAVMFLFFAAGHTYGFLNFEAPTAEGRAVLESMNRVHFQGFSYGGWYRGFGISATFSLLLSAYLAWHLGNLARTTPKAIGGMGWALFLTQILGMGLSVMYFPLPPVILSGIVAACIAGAEIQLMRK